MYLRFETQLPKCLPLPNFVELVTFHLISALFFIVLTSKATLLFRDDGPN